MVNNKYALLSELSNDDLLQELLHRMENFSKYNLILDKWNSFKDCDDENTDYAIKIERRV